MYAAANTGEYATIPAIPNATPRMSVGISAGIFLNERTIFIQLLVKYAGYIQRPWQECDHRGRRIYTK